MQEVILYIQPELRSGATGEFVRVDLMEPELITLTQVIQDVKEIDQIFTNYSRTFNLPASKKNNILFKRWYNPDIVGFDNQIMANARIELNHLPFKEGKIRLESVTIKHGQPSLYKVTFFGKTITITELFGDDELSSLDWLDNFNHTYNTTNVKAGLETGLDFTVDSVSYTNAVIYPLLTHSQQYNYDSSIISIISGAATSTASDKLVDNSVTFGGLIAVGDIVKNTTDNTVANVVFIDSDIQLELSSDIMSNGETYTIYRANPNNLFVATSSADPSYNRRGVLSEDLKPAITVKIILKAIEQKYGITFKTGEFFDTSVMTNMYLWLHRNKGKIITSGVWESYNDSYNCTSATAIECTQATDSTNSVAQSLGFFKVNEGVLFWKRFIPDTFQFVFEDITVYTLEITPASGSVNVKYDLELTVNGGDSLISANSLQGTNSIVLRIGDTSGLNINTLSAQYGNSFNIVGRLSSSEPIQFQAKFTLDRKVAFVDNTGNFAIFTEFDYTAVLTSVSATLQPSNSLLQITRRVPKIKVLDFLKGLFKIHNLTAFVDLTGQIVVKTIDSFYSGGDTLELTKYVNTDERTVNKTESFSEINFEYSEAKTILAQQFEQSNNRKYGELEFFSGASKGKTFKIEAPFEHMLFERLNNINSGGTITETDIQYGAFLDDNLNPSIGQPLLFYGIYRENISTPINFVEGTFRPTDGSLPAAGTNSSLDDYWMPHNANELGTTTTAPTYNLNFGSEINSYTLTDYSGINNSLFQLYYQNYILRVFNKRTRLFNYKAILPLNILLKLSLDDTIIIQERAFTINKMTTKLQSGETEFELLNEPT